MTKKLTRRDLISIGGAASGAVLASSVIAPGSAKAAPGKDKDEALPQVPRRVLGRTKEEIPILVMGMAMRLDQRFDPKLAECVRFGIDYFDAADCYAGGTSELALGSFLKKTGIRKKIWITSKSDEHDPDGFEATLNQSLKKMETDHVDLYYLHALKDPDSLNNELKKKVDALKKTKKLKYFGFSCHSGTVVELLEKAAKIGWVDSIMFRYNFRQYGNKELNKAIDAAHKANIGLIAMKTQGSEASFSDAWKKFEKTGKWNKFQAVLKAVWADDRITAAVSHMDTFEKLKQNIAAAVDKTELGANEWDSLRKYADATRTFACDGCDHLCGAQVDAPVQIGDTMRYLMYHDMYGDKEGAAKLFKQLPRAAQQLSSLDFSRANAACPHGINVGWHMKRAEKLFLG